MKVLSIIFFMFVFLFQQDARKRFSGVMGELFRILLLLYGTNSLMVDIMLICMVTKPWSMGSYTVGPTYSLYGWISFRVDDLHNNTTISYCPSVQFDSTMTFVCYII